MVCVIDAEGKPLGRVAAEAAVLLRGKHKPIFTPNVDCGDFVIIINTDKAVLTGDKLNKKLYQHHTGYIGNLKEVKYGTLMNEKVILLWSFAVKGMIPQAQHRGRKQLTRCHIYKGAEHKHEARSLKLGKWEVYRLCTKQILISTAQAEEKNL